MFLQELNEMERKKFLELAVHGMKVNNELHESQLEIIDTFKLEMGLEAYEVTDTNIDDILSFFVDSTKSVKKIVFIELFGVLLSDGVFDDMEKELVQLCSNKWSFHNSEINKMKRWVKDFNDLLSEGYEYILR